MMAKFLTLQLMDYCSNPGYLASDQKRRRENSGKAAEKNTKISLNDIKKDGAYYGYTWVDSSPGNNAQNVHVYVVVDNQFRIHIQGIDHVRLDAARQLLDMIPVETLAKVGK